VRALALLLLVTGCAAWQPQPAEQPVLVSALNVDFPVRDHGSLEFSLRMPSQTPPVRAVSWELFLDGVRFASGLEGEVKREGDVLSVQSLLVSRHLAWREGDASLDVGLRGEIDVGIPGEKLGFRERREVPVHGRPMLNIPLD
jgi:hypothetical protein